MTITAPACQFDGFSKLASWVASYRLQNHLPTKWKTTRFNDKYGNFRVRFPQVLLDLTAVESGDDSVVVFAHADEMILPPSENSVIVTGFTNNAVSSDALAILKRYKRVILPDLHQAKAAVAFGVSQATWVYPPTDGRIYFADGRKNLGRKFGFVAKSAKTLQLGLDVWFEAFPGIDDVLLQIKLEPGVKLPPLNDHRITTIEGWLEPYRLANWYRGLDCFLSTSTGRYFDWHTEQAAMCSTPTIGTAWNACFGAGGCSTKFGKAMSIPKAVDWMRLCYFDPAYMSDTAVMASDSRSSHQYAHDIHQIVQCTTLPQLSDTPETLETSSTPCPSCGG